MSGGGELSRLLPGGVSRADYERERRPPGRGQLWQPCADAGADDVVPDESGGRAGDTRQVRGAVSHAGTRRQAQSRAVNGDRTRRCVLLRLYLIALV